MHVYNSCVLGQAQHRVLFLVYPPLWCKSQMEDGPTYGATHIIPCSLCRTSFGNYFVDQLLHRCLVLAIVVCLCLVRDGGGWNTFVARLEARAAFDAAPGLGGTMVLNGCSAHGAHPDTTNGKGVGGGGQEPH